MSGTLTASEPASRPTAAAHFVGIDGARAVAAFSVVLVHLTLYTGYVFRSPLGPFFARADIGVSIFFALSGFLLYRPFVVRRLTDAPPDDLGAYARRRVLRVFPAYWVALTIVAFVLRAPGFSDGQSIVAKYLLLHVYDINQVTGGPIQQSWSLSTELSFYVFLPIWAWFLGRRRRDPHRQLRVELWALGVMWALAIGLKVVLAASSLSAAQVGWLGCWLPLRLDEFALGMTLAVLSAWISVKGISAPTWVRGWSGVAIFWGIAGVAFVVLCTGFDLPLDLSFTPTQFLGTRVAFSLIATLFLVPIVFASPGRGPVPAILGNRVMVWLGLISYGVYIWHEAWQIKYLDWTGQPELAASMPGMTVVTVTLTIATAALSWYLIERPVIRFARRSL